MAPELMVPLAVTLIKLRWEQGDCSSRIVCKDTRAIDSERTARAGRDVDAAGASRPVRECTNSKPAVGVGERGVCTTGHKNIASASRERVNRKCGVRQGVPRVLSKRVNTADIARTIDNNIARIRRVADLGVYRRRGTERRSSTTRKSGSGYQNAAEPCGALMG